MGAYDFGWALSALKNGLRVCRKGWNGKGIWIQLRTPDSSSKMTLPYIYIEYPKGCRVPWLASQTDLLSEDWQVFQEEK